MIFFSLSFFLAQVNILIPQPDSNNACFIMYPQTWHDIMLNKILNFKFHWLILIFIILKLILFIKFQNLEI